MYSIDKAHKLDNVCYDIRGPVHKEARRLEDEGHRILKLNIGNPAPFGFDAPEEVIKDVILNMSQGQGYCDSKGLFAARKAIAQHYQQKGLRKADVDDIYIGNGASELIVMAMQALLNNGDEMLVPAPDYPLWTAAVTLSGGHPVHYICDEQADWYPDIDDIKKKITPKTRGIILINPNNPTGAIYGPDILLEIAQIARENDLIIFADEIYDRLLMDGHTHTSIASLAPDLFIITLNGLSKSHLIAGYRCGWMTLSGDRSHVKGYIEGINMLSSMRLCSNVPAQRAVKPALADLDATRYLFEPGGRVYEQRRACMEALDRVDGVTYVKPQAAFYVFPRVDAKRFNIKNDEQFVLDFLREQHVLLVHGGGFHWNEPDHFRIVYLPEPAVLTEAIDKLGVFLETYQQK